MHTCVVLCLKIGINIVKNKICLNLIFKNLVPCLTEDTVHLYFEDIMLNVTYSENCMKRIS